MGPDEREEGSEPTNPEGAPAQTTCSRMASTSAHTACEGEGGRANRSSGGGSSCGSHTHGLREGRERLEERRPVEVVGEAEPEA